MTWALLALWPIVSLGVALGLGAIVRLIDRRRLVTWDEDGPHWHWERLR